ncbi:MAG: putative Na+/H+ antiporter, partial [Desulfobacterales bacterium]
MKQLLNAKGKRVFLILAAFVLCGSVAWGASPPAEGAADFPRSLESYGDQDSPGILAVLANRIRQQPFNLLATLIFFCAIVHTFLASKFMTRAHKWEHEHEKKVKLGIADKYSIHYGAELFHFLGEVEVIFGLWALALLAAIIGFFDWKTALNYVSYRVNFVEPLFVVVIMTLAATRPILKLSEIVMQKIAGVLGGSL